MISTRWLAVLGLIATAGLATAMAQREKPTVDDSMSALVAEIRALRLAVERSMLATTQAQLLLGRVQLQESRLATLGRQVQEARIRLADAQLAQGELEGELRRLVEGADSVPSAEERQAYQPRIVQLKQQVKQQQIRTNQLRADESAAADALSTEQNRWSDFNERLEALERTLASQAAPPR